MSRAGKFIPGGGGKAARTGPIRAPDPAAPPPDPAAPAGGGGKKPFVKGSLVKPVAKSQRLPIVIMSGIVCCLLVSAGWYTLAYLPGHPQPGSPPSRRSCEAQQQLADQAGGRAKGQRGRARGGWRRSAASSPSTAIPPAPPSPSAISARRPPPSLPTSFPGTFTLVIHADGYEDYKQDVTVTADKPTDLGTITLAQKTGNLSLTSPQSEVTYTAHRSRRLLPRRAGARQTRKIARRRLSHHGYAGRLEATARAHHDSRPRQRAEGHQVPLRQRFHHQRAAGRHRAGWPHRSRTDAACRSPRCARGPPSFRRSPALHPAARRYPRSRLRQCDQTSHVATGQGFHRRLRHADGLDSRRRFLGGKISGPAE